MAYAESRANLLLSVQRALLGETHAQFRQVSIEADEALAIIRIRFEFDGVPNGSAKESASRAATEVIADFPSPWRIEEEYLSVPFPTALSPLQYVAYLRFERQDGT